MRVDFSYPDPLFCVYNPTIEITLVQFKICKYGRGVFIQIFIVVVINKNFGIHLFSNFKEVEKILTLRPFNM